MVWAANNIKNIDSKKCREWTVQNFSLERVSAMYEEYFYQIYNLWEEGWYETNSNRDNLDWLRKYYPSNE